jgi:predicted nucleotidyltransferase
LKNSLQSAISDFEGLYLFGSQATGKADKNSDIDIVILFKNKRYWQPSDYHRILSEISCKYDADLDTHPMTKQELEADYYFCSEVMNNGIFYGRTA